MRKTDRTHVNRPPSTVDDYLALFYCRLGKIPTFYTIHLAQTTMSSFVGPRIFGPLGRKSLGTFGKKWTQTPQAFPQVESPNKLRNIVDTDRILESVFARQIPLPHHLGINFSSGMLAREDVAYFPSSNNTNQEVEMSNLPEIFAMNRNARRPNKANRGARPCSRSSRRWKKDQIGKRRR